MAFISFVPFATTSALPGAVFDSRDALIEFVPFQMQVEQVLSAFERHRDEFALAVELGELGFEESEIAELAANPGSRPRIGYMVG